MYGSVLSGGLSGHVHGTAAYDITSTGEPAGARPQIWKALQYESGKQMQHLKSFVLSEGGRYQGLQLYHHHLHPQKAKNSSYLLVIKSSLNYDLIIRIGCKLFDSWLSAYFINC